MAKSKLRCIECELGGMCPCKECTSTDLSCPNNGKWCGCRGEESVIKTVVIRNAKSSDCQL